MASIEQLSLPDGRRLDFRVSGPDEGMPLVFHHGTPGAATPFRSIERAAHHRGLRLVTTSRPGYGSSSRRAGRQIVDVVVDTGALLEALGAEHCLVAGWSGGGPHALACAAHLGAVRAALVIAGVAPHDADDLDWTAGMGADNLAELGAAEQGELQLRPYLLDQREHLADIAPGDLISALETLLPEVDRAALAGELGQDLAESFHEALRHGVDGWVDDDLAFTKPWGFDLADISVPTAIWQGTADLMVPLSHGRWLASRIPVATLHQEPGHGHLSITAAALDRMLDQLVEAGA
jgi:pimeloyl-ACP methyl ester carboxylesterase